MVSLIATQVPRRMPVHVMPELYSQAGQVLCGAGFMFESINISGCYDLFCELFPVGIHSAVSKTKETNYRNTK